MLRTSMLSWSDKKRVRVALGGLLAAAAVTASGGLAAAAAPLPASRVATPVVQAQVVVPVLVKALQDPVPKVSQLAADALKRIDPAAAVKGEIR